MMTEQEFMRRWLLLLAEETAAEGIPHAVVARELGVSDDVYAKWRSGRRRMRSWFFLKLCRRFGLPRDPEELVGTRVCFDAPFAGIQTGSERLARYVTILQELTSTLAQRGGVAPTISASTTDVPVPYFFSFPTLRAVKLYYFAASDAEFDWPPLTEFIRTVREEASLVEVAKAYRASSRTEVWGERALDSVTCQLRKLSTVGALTDKGYEAAVGELEELIQTFEAELKLKGGPLQIHTDGSSSRSPRFIVESNGHTKVILTDDPPYFNVTQDAPTVDLAKRAFQNRLALAQNVATYGHLSIDRFLTSLREGLPTISPRRGTGDRSRKLSVLHAPH